MSFIFLSAHGSPGWGGRAERGCDMKPYREGNGWAVRVRVRGHAVYLSGFSTEAAARREAARQTAAIQEIGKPARGGPNRTSVALAFQQYACEKLPGLKGAIQDANRMNVYLRAGGQDTLAVTKFSPRENHQDDSHRVVYCRVELVPHAQARRIANSLRSHREAQSAKRTRTEILRQRIACTAMADVTPHLLQQLVHAMVQEGASASTIHLEIAQLKRLFYYATQKWLWVQPARNPAAGLDLPAVDNARDRVLTKDEWKRLCVALDAYPNPHVAPAIAVLLETAMRVSEPLLNIHWSDVLWERAVIALPDAKAGKREVPLTPDALALLRALHALRSGNEVFPLTYEALKKGWTTACAQAGVRGVHIHDLRHTAATRFALEFRGNKFVLKIITGHKTDSQLGRYVNLKVDDVVGLMHGRTVNDAGPASLGDAMPALRANARPTGQTEVGTEACADTHTETVTETNAKTTHAASNVIHADFGKRRAA